MRYQNDVLYFIDEHGEEQCVAMPEVNGEPDEIISIEPIGFLQNEAYIRTKTFLYRAEWLKKKDFTRIILIEGPKTGV